MKNLINIYKVNKGISPLFSEYEIFDWYDGATSGIAKLNETDNFYLFNMVAWDINTGIRIFSLLEVKSTWLDKIKPDLSNPNNFNRLIEDFLNNYLGNAYLFKSKYIDDSEYNLVQVDVKDLKYYRGIDDIANQDEEVKKMWFGFFD